MTLVLGGVPGSGFAVGLSAGLPGLAATFDSIFLFVTGAFNWTVSCFPADFPWGFGVALSTAPAALVDMDFPVLTCSETVFVGFVAATGLLDSTFFATVLMSALLVDLDRTLTVARGGADFTDDCFAFFAEDIWDFAGFFIAFAMESAVKIGRATNKRDCLYIFHYTVCTTRSLLRPTVVSCITLMRAVCGAPESLHFGYFLALCNDIQALKMT